MTVETQARVELAYRFEPGQQLRYRVETVLEQEVLEEGKSVRRQNQTVAMEMTQKVLCPDGEGGAHIVTSYQPERRSSSLYQHLNRQGATLASAGPDPGSYAQLPADPVAPGQSWRAEIEVALPWLEEPVKLPYVSTLVKVADDLATIQIRSEELCLDLPLPAEAGQARVLLQAEGRLSYALSHGRIQRLEITLRTYPRIGTVSFDTTQRLVQELLG